MRAIELLVRTASFKASKLATTSPPRTTSAVISLRLAMRCSPRRARSSSGYSSSTVMAVRKPRPPRFTGNSGISRRRQTVERVALLAAAVAGGDAPAIEAARLDLHGALPPAGPGPLRIAPDIEVAVVAEVLAAVDPGANLPAARAIAAVGLRRRATIERAAAATAGAAVLDRLVADGRLVRDGATVTRPGSIPSLPPRDPALAAAMDRLEGALAVAAPPALAEAAQAAGCPPDAVRELERGGRIVVLEPDLAYASSTYAEIAAAAVEAAHRGPLTPAALRDATGSSRKYVMAILADLDRRGILRRTPDGHLPGPRAGAGIVAGATALTAAETTVR